jgi:hypothetical protein
MYDKSGRVALLWSMDATIAVNTKARALQASITFSQGRLTRDENFLENLPPVAPGAARSFLAFVYCSKPLASLAEWSVSLQGSHRRSISPFSEWAFGAFPWDLKWL